MRIGYINQKLNIYDYPDKKRKLQKEPIAVSGGLLLFINTIVIFFYLFLKNLNTSMLLINSYEFYLNILFISLFWIIGLMDDKFELKATTKIALMLFIIILYVNLTNYGVVKKFYFSNEKSVDLGNFFQIFTIFCIFTLTLTLNMFDGIDGQSIIFYIFLSTYLFFFHNIEITGYLLIPLIVSLVLNLKQKLYLGDNGVMLFSAILSIILIKYNFSFPQKIFADEILLILLIPALDLIRLIFHRMYSKKNPLKADNFHIHHLSTQFISKKNYLFISIIYYFLLFAFLYTEVKFYYLILLITFLYFALLTYFFKNKKNKKKNS